MSEKQVLITVGTTKFENLIKAIDTESKEGHQMMAFFFCSIGSALELQKLESL